MKKTDFSRNGVEGMASSGRNLFPEKYSVRHEMDGRNLFPELSKLRKGGGRLLGGPFVPIIASP